MPAPVVVAVVAAKESSVGKRIASAVVGGAGLLVLMFVCVTVGVSTSIVTHTGPSGRFLPGANIGLDAAQLRQAARALGVADSLNTGDMPVLAMVVGALGESNFRPVPNTKGSGYCGVFQANPAIIACDNTEEQAKSFLLGGKGFGQGGAIALANSKPHYTPGLIATLVEVSGQPGSFYDVYRAQAEKIIAAWRAGAGSFPSPPNDATAGTVLGNPNVILTPGQRADIQSGGIDARVLSTLAFAGSRHRITVTALRRDHSTNTVEGNRSNHSFGRAVDIGAVDGQVCSEVWGAAPDWGSTCGGLLRELVALSPPLRSTELIYCWDPDGPGDPRGFARADHCNHIHIGFDAGVP